MAHIKEQFAFMATAEANRIALPIRAPPPPLHSMIGWQMKRWSYKKSKYIDVPAIDEFLLDIIAVCKKHGMSLAHEDSHGAFIIESYDEENIRHLEHAMDRLTRIHE